MDKTIISLILCLLFVSCNNRVSQRSLIKSTYTIKEISEAETSHFFGYVKDINTGNILQGANIKIKGTTTGTVTDDQGFFKLQVPPGEIQIQVYYVGYPNLISKTLRIKPMEKIEIHFQMGSGIQIICG